MRRFFGLLLICAFTVPSMAVPASANSAREAEEEREAFSDWEDECSAEERQFLRQKPPAKAGTPHCPDLKSSPGFVEPGPSVATSRVTQLLSPNPPPTR